MFSSAQLFRIFPFEAKPFAQFSRIYETLGDIERRLIRRKLCLAFFSFNLLTEHRAGRFAAVFIQIMLHLDRTEKSLSRFVILQ